MGSETLHRLLRECDGLLAPVLGPVHPVRYEIRRLLVRDDVMMTFCAAVAREEGFGKAGTRPTRNNNPGDIEWGRFAEAHGATHAEQPQGRFAVFPSVEAGMAAMKALFAAPGYKGKTIEQALNRWAPPVENATNSYIANVCAWTGLRSDTVIDGVL